MVGPNANMPVTLLPAKKTGTGTPGTLLATKSTCLSIPPTYPTGSMLRAPAIVSVTESEGSSRAAMATRCSARIRAAGSASPTGTISRCRVIRLPQLVSCPARRLIGMRARRESTAAPCRSWYLRSPPAMAAR